MTEKNGLTHHWKRLATLAGVALAWGCGNGDDGPTGSLTVLLESEDVIVDGLEPGTGVENLRDGWTASFEKYLITIGDLELELATDDSVEVHAPDVFVADLTAVPASGLPLWEIDGLRAGRWQFGYATPTAKSRSKRHASVDQADYDAVVANGWTYFIDGVLTKPDGQSCPPAALAAPGDRTPNGNTSGENDCYDAPSVRFTFGAAADTFYSKCEIDGIPGVAIPAGGTQSVSLTIHGDHLFFNGFPEGGEGGVTRLAQWLADCDLDLDGTVTREELEAIAPSALPEIDERYQLGGSPIEQLDDMVDYLVAQLKTQGHIQGEGECEVDGAAHSH
jgi:hypothetical protein